jgi:hypothetical protein
MSHREAVDQNKDSEDRQLSRRRSVRVQEQNVQVCESKRVICFERELNEVDFLRVLCVLQHHRYHTLTTQYEELPRSLLPLQTNKTKQNKTKTQHKQKKTKQI